ncbi:MAG: hypothetical protein GPJ54_09380 [Candidatus Heimdallarchaeota archaeon]|nr:hypothetical protein [Candidatus Heimdallarchaeota archaeon]
MLNITKSFLIASIILMLGSLTAATSHWFAHTEQDFRFTLLGFMAAIFSGMYYGLSVENRKSKNLKYPQAS